MTDQRRSEFPHIRLLNLPFPLFVRYDYVDADSNFAVFNYDQNV